MQRYTQTLEEILKTLAAVQASGVDELSEKIIEFIGTFPEQKQYQSGDLIKLLEQNFEVGIVTFRLFLGISDDKFKVQFGKVMGKGGMGITAFKKDKQTYVNGLIEIGLGKLLPALINKPTTWRDVLIERLMSGRGRAIEGMKRGRSLEDHTEKIVLEVFGKKNYEPRCRFVGKDGSTEKTDFAIPTKKAADILIEVKAYGATGSKQTDILGDMSRIVEKKRHDTVLILVTDGDTWHSRQNDMRKLIEYQNKGAIHRIYTVAMAAELKKDLQQLKTEKGL